MRARAFAWAIAVAMVATLLLLTARVWVLVMDGGIVPLLLGLSVLAIVAIGGWLLVREVFFGVQTQRLGARLREEGGLPIDDLPRTPSGRIELAAAQQRFTEAQAQAEKDPDDWRMWYRLAVAYDDARDRRQARAAMRRAIRLAKEA